MEAKNASLTLSEEEENGVIIDDDDIADAMERYKYVLVGKLLTDKPVNFDKMKDTIASIWRPGMGMCVNQVDYNLFVFQLFHERDLDRIIEDGPWSYKRGLLVLKRLSVYESPCDVTLTKVDFWVQIHKIPLGFFSEKIAEVIGASIGDFLHVDKKNFDGTWKPFMRIRVALDTTKPLKRKMKIKKEGGEWIWVEFKYERLPTFCYLCGIIGHGDRFCPKLYEIEAEKEAERPYGAWLRTTRRGKKWLAGQQWLVSGPPPRSETQNTVEKDSSAGVEQIHVCETKNTMEKDSSAGVEQADVEDFVKDVGEVKDVSASHPDGVVNGVGHVEFATSEASEKNSDEEEDEASDEYSDEEEDEDYSGEEEDEESEEYSDEDEDDASEEDEPSKPPEKMTPVTSTAEAQGGSNTIFMGNLSWSIEEGDVEDFFKDVGEVKEIRLALHPDGTSRGFGHVEFATSEAAVKALELNGQRLLGRGVNLDFAIERGAYTPNCGRSDNSFQDGRSEGGGESTIVFVRGFDTNDTEDKIVSDLEEHFGGCGEIKDIRLPTYSEGCLRGMAYIEFTDSVEMKNALELNNSQIGNYSLYVDEAKPRSRDW